MLAQFGAISVAITSELQQERAVMTTMSHVEYSAAVSIAAHSIAPRHCRPFLNLLTLTAKKRHLKSLLRAKNRIPFFAHGSTCVTCLGDTSLWLSWLMRDAGCSSGPCI